MPAALPLSHALLGLAVVAVWGSNFVVIRHALDTFTPLWLATLRFALAVVPMVFFLRRPAASWRNLAAYGVAIGAGQFGLLFLALNGHISPGLASLVVQMQVFFTVGLASWRSRERLRGWHYSALLLAVSGLVWIALHAGGSASPLGLALVLGAAASWAAGNMVSRAAGRVDMLAYVVWGSLFSVPPLLVLAWATEGLPALQTAVQHARLSAWLALVWQSVGNTLFGYAAWGWLLARHPAATVTPLALGVPVFGMATAAWAMGETFPPWKAIGMALVMAGLAVNVLAPRWFGRAGRGL